MGVAVAGGLEGIREGSLVGIKVTGAGVCARGDAVGVIVGGDVATQDRLSLQVAAPQEPSAMQWHHLAVQSAWPLPQEQSLQPSCHSPQSPCWHSKGAASHPAETGARGLGKQASLLVQAAKPPHELEAMQPHIRVVHLATDASSPQEQSLHPSFQSEQCWPGGQSKSDADDAQTSAWTFLCTITNRGSNTRTIRRIIVVSAYRR